jgi:DNA-directed RNA polymerase subunit RPC12/RpoP
MAKELYLKCTDCKSEFLADMQMDESSLSVFEGNSQDCPSCGALTRLTQETAVFRDEVPSKVPGVSIS